MPALLNFSLVLLLAVALVAAVVLVILTATADRWVVALLSRLDALLTRLGVGKWSAGILTRCEDWARARRERRAARGASKDGGP